jgi:hypothetical protein
MSVICVLSLQQSVENPPPKIEPILSILSRVWLYCVHVYCIFNKAWRIPPQRSSLFCLFCLESDCAVYTCTVSSTNMAIVGTGYQDLDSVRNIELSLQNCHRIYTHFKFPTDSTVTPTLTPISPLLRSSYVCKNRCCEFNLKWVLKSTRIVSSKISYQFDIFRKNRRSCVFSRTH